MPTDTGYAFVARVDSKDAVLRLLEIKGDGKRKKPLSLLCRDLATIDAYACRRPDVARVAATWIVHGGGSSADERVGRRYARFSSRKTFKVLKNALPGPYTFVLPASEALPRALLAGGKRQWKRNTVGVRIPADDVRCPRGNQPGSRGDESRRRRGRDVAIPWRRVAAAPRPRRGYSVEASRGGDVAEMFKHLEGAVRFG